jgi:uncharacterized protein DUF3467
MKSKSDDSATMTLTNPNESPAASPKNPTAGDRVAAEENRRPSAVEVDDSHVVASYVNFCRVSSTPEELILDLGLNPQPMNPAVSKISVSQRTIMNHYTAKRLLAALSTALQRHESAFGVLETDVRRRVRAV